MDEYRDKPANHPPTGAGFSPSTVFCAAFVLKTAHVAQTSFDRSDLLSREYLAALWLPRTCGSLPLLDTNHFFFGGVPYFDTRTYIHIYIYIIHT